MAELEMMLVGLGMSQGRWIKTSSPTSGRRMLLSRTSLRKGRSGGERVVRRGSHSWRCGGGGGGMNVA